MSGRHRKPTASAVNVAKIAFTGAVIGTGGLALAGQANAATDGEWDQVASANPAATGPSTPATDITADFSSRRAPGAATAAASSRRRRYLASKEEQIAVAERVLAGQGKGAWPSCGRSALRPHPPQRRRRCDRQPEQPAAASAASTPLRRRHLPRRRRSTRWPRPCLRHRRRSTRWHRRHPRHRSRRWPPRPRHRRRSTRWHRRHPRHRSRRWPPRPPPPPAPMHRRHPRPVDAMAAPASPLRRPCTAAAPARSTRWLPGPHRRRPRRRLRRRSMRWPPRFPAATGPAASAGSALRRAGRTASRAAPAESCSPWRTGMSQRARRPAISHRCGHCIRMPRFSPPRRCRRLRPGSAARAVAAPAPDPLAPINAVDVPQPAFDAANQAVSGELPVPAEVPHLPSPENLNPGTTTDRAAVTDSQPERLVPQGDLARDPDPGCHRQGCAAGADSASADDAGSRRGPAPTLPGPAPA